MGNRRSNLTLLSNASASGAAQTVPQGGRYIYSVAGTFGGTSSKLQILGPDSTTFIDVPNTTFTVAGYVAVELPVGAQVKTVLTGGTPSAMYATLGSV